MLMERLGVQGSSFILQIILARILSPEHYGVLSMMLIFTALANVFIQRGFNAALIQNKDVNEDDCSSIFWVTTAIALLMYAILYFAAPYIAVFYEMPSLTDPFRVLCLMLIPGAYNSIQIAIVSRELDFKKVFRTNLASIVISGVISIIMAMRGFGLWSLVAQRLLNICIACITMHYSITWRPRFVFNVQRVKVLFSYGWKMLVSSLVNTLYLDLRSLVIGKKFDSTTLAFYNKGKNFPQFLIRIINSTLQSVMLPAMSSEQDNHSQVKSLVRHSAAISAYVVFPLMAGLAAVAKPLVLLLLTEKWFFCVPFLQIYCFALAVEPVLTCSLQAISALGRSDVLMKLEIAKKGFGIISLILAAVFFTSPVAIALTGALTALFSVIVSAAPNKKLLGYSYREQLLDVVPSLAASLLMALAVIAVGQIKLPSFALLCLQILTGIIVYIGISAGCRLRPFRILLKTILRK